MSHKMIFFCEDAKRHISELLKRLAALGGHIGVEKLYKASNSSINIYQLEIKNKKAFVKHMINFERYGANSDYESQSLKSLKA